MLSIEYAIHSLLAALKLVEQQPETGIFGPRYYQRVTVSLKAGEIRALVEFLEGEVVEGERRMALKPKGCECRPDWFCDKCHREVMDEIS